MKTNFIKILSLFLVLIGLQACETTDLDINDNPNQLTVDSANPNYILNTIQIAFAQQQGSLSATSSGVMRHRHLFGTYASASGTGTMNGPWGATYIIANNLKSLKELSENRNLPNHVGIGQILEAYAYVNLVDYIGTAVFSEAVNPDFPQPNLDDGKSIYDAMYIQIDEAIANLNATGSVAPEDLYYNGDMSKWVKLANTLKLRMYIQSKLVADASTTTSINSIINSGNYIKEPSDDFIIRYGTNVTNPDTRHPFFVGGYVNGAGGAGYMSNDLIYKMKDEKSVDDPRLKYYFYRQTLDAPTGTLIPCAGDTNAQYCYLGDGYWGRDHTYNDGIPNDNQLRTTYGIYPGGGKYDDGESNTFTTDSDGLKGAGIQPILLSSFVNFLLAESSLSTPYGLGTTGNSKDYLLAGIRQSFSVVENLSKISMNETDKTDYINFVSNQYDTAANDEGKLKVIMKEFYIASFGNSVEAYNAYRRTGFPELGNAVIANTDFPRSYFIPDSEINSNDNPDLEQKKLTDQVFWDTNPSGFIN